MDAKITKNRIGGMLSYDWYKIILIIVGLILAWTFVFNATATKITNTQQFTVINYTGNNPFSKTRFYTLYEMADKEAFSYEVIETNVIDGAENGGDSEDAINSRMRTGEGDVVFLANVGDSRTAYLGEDGKEILYERTYAQSFMLSNFWYLYDLDENSEDSYFNRLETYLNGYYFGDYTLGQMDEDKVETDFRARTKKDKRFKTKSQIAQGVEDEKARIAAYCQAYINFLDYCEKGWIEFIYTEVTQKGEEGETLILADGIRTIGFAFDEAGMERLEGVVNYTTLDGDSTKTTAEDMTLGFINTGKTKHGFEYESLLFVDYLVQWCTRA